MNKYINKMNLKSYKNNNEYKSRYIKKLILRLTYWNSLKINKANICSVLFANVTWTTTWFP